MNKKIFKQILIVLGTVILFLALSYGFTPEVLQGKIVNQSDISSWHGMTKEILDHNAAHPDDKTQWTNSMFGGMPTVTILDDFDGDTTNPLYHWLLTGKRPATYLFIALLGGFLLMLSMGIRWSLAIGGAIAIAFCSYNFQIIQVGHNTKMQAIAFAPWVLAAMIFTYRSALAALENRHWTSWLPKTILGATLFGFALSFQIKANHPQITYYLAIIVFIYAITQFISVCIPKDRKDRLIRFFAASGLLLVIGLTGVATNLNKLIPTYEYTQVTMRGGSELVEDNGTSNSKGLDLDYATAWSYGINEMPNLMIPNFNGGASAGELSKDSETYKVLRQAGQPNVNSIIKQMPLYWGPQPFTAGPMYLGAICIFLFVLGLFLFKGKEKWWLLATTIIAIFLAWGSHFMWFTKLWFNWAPMYNKFRTVSMALTILQITVPLLGFLVLDRVLKGKYEYKQILNSSIIAFILTGGFCLIAAAFPGIAGDFISASDASLPEILRDSLAADRSTLLVKDALNSLGLISITFLLILLTLRIQNKDKYEHKINVLCVTITLLVLVDLMSTGKRYLNSSHFVTPKSFNGQFAERPVDQLIHQDTDLDYRVLDISVNTFNDAHQSYQHKCIGGYSPAKMQRYQDLIEKYIAPEINSIYNTVSECETIGEVEDKLPYLPITSMLNGRYIILGAEYPPIINEKAFGNAWFTDNALFVSSPQDEIQALSLTDLNNTAVISKDQFQWTEEFFNNEESNDSNNQYIELTHYAPNYLRYSVNTTDIQPTIFSEIYYEGGWKAWYEPKDDKMGTVKKGRYIPSDNAIELPLFRANWILRGTIVPEGKGEIVMRFEPDSYTLGKNLSRASSITLYILLILAVGGMIASNILQKKELDSKN